MTDIKRLACGVWVVDGDELHTRWIEECGHLDHDAYAWSILSPLLHPGDTVVDVGAHWGTHTSFYLRAVNPGGKVIAYEPHLLSFTCLSLNCPKARIFNMALSDHQGYEHLTSTPGNVGASHLNAHATGEKVFLATLDSHASFWLEPNDRIRLIKMDCEGAEPEVLLGAFETIKQHRPYLFIEVNPGALLRRGYTTHGLRMSLASLGYRAAFYPPQSNWNSPQSDILCTPIA
jgi:FkbM family methyltransferase